MLGDVDYNKIFEVIDIVDAKGLQANLFRKKGEVHRRYARSGSNGTTNTAPWAMTGDVDVHQSQRNEFDNISIEIKIDIEQSLVGREDFTLDGTPFMDILSLDSVRMNPLTSIQVVQKQGDNYEVNTFKLKEVAGELKLQHYSKASIDAGMYRDNYFFEDQEFGFCSLITNLSVPLMFFKDIKCSAIYTSKFIQGHSAPQTVTTRYDGDSVSKASPNGRTFPHFNYEGEFTFYAGIALRAISKIRQARTSVQYSSDIWDRIGLIYNSSQRYERLLFNKFSEFDYDRDIETDHDYFRIILSPKDTEESKNNRANPLNKFTYSPLIRFQDNKLDLIRAYDVIGTEFSIEQLSQKVNVADKARLANIEVNLLVPKDQESCATKEQIKELHINNYNQEIDMLKYQWEKTLAVYNRVYKGKKIDINMLAILFIQKYFVPQADSPNYLMEDVEDKLTLVLNFFNNNYTDFENMFGTDHISKYINGMVSIDAQIWSWSNSRLESEGKMFARAQRNKGSYSHETASLWPNNNCSNLRRTPQHRYKSLLIINDSLTKESWKKKTRIFIKKLKSTMPIGNIYVLDVQDKFQLMVVKRLVSEYSGLMFYSDFADDIVEPKKVKNVVENSTISYYSADSYRSTTKTIKPSKMRLDLIEPDKYIFIEFSSTKKVVTFQGKDYDEKSFGFPFWSKLIGEYQGKNLIQVSKTTLKKIKEYGGDDIILLDDCIEDEEFIKNFKRVSDSHYFIKPDRSERNLAIRLMEFTCREFIEPFRNNSVNAKMVSPVVYTILKSFNPGNQKLFGSLIRMALIESSRRNRSYSVLRDMQNKIVNIPEPDSLDGILFTTITPDPEYTDIMDAAAKISPVIMDSSFYTYRSKLFGLEELIRDNNKLLNMSNKLNMSIEESTKKRNALLIDYAHQWDSMIRFMEA